ncbi:MAG: PAS domain-containing protein, partial [Segetibacter sp.]
MEETGASSKERTLHYNSFMNAPAGIAIFKGDAHICEFANAALEKVVDRKIIIGKPIRELIPEIEQQCYWQILDNAFATGEPFIGNELPVDLKRKGDGILGKHYLNIVVQPLKDEKGNTERLLLHVIEVSTQVEARIQIKESEDKLHNLSLQAPVLNTTLKGPSFVVETVNKMTLDIWGKYYEEVINKPLFEASPELKDGLERILNDVYITGKPFMANEIPIQLKRTGKPDMAYFNSDYQPLR